MPKRYLKLALWILPVLVIILYLLDRYVWLTPEEEVWRLIEQGRRAGEARSVLRCDPLLARDFRTASGFGRGEFLYFLRTEFNRLADLQVDLGDREVTLSENQTSAEVRLEVSLSGTDSDGSRWRGFGEGQRSGLVYLQIEKRDGKWKAVFAEW